VICKSKQNGECTKSKENIFHMKAAVGEEKLKSGNRWAVGALLFQDRLHALSPL
jgi:hypothetical protein